VVAVKKILNLMALGGQPGTKTEKWTVCSILFNIGKKLTKKRDDDVKYFLNWKFQIVI